MNAAYQILSKISNYILITRIQLIFKLIVKIHLNTPMYSEKIYLNTLTRILKNLFEHTHVF